MAFRVVIFMSEKKSENLPESFECEPFDSGESREHLLQELRTRAERFYGRASLEQIVEVTCMVRSLLATIERFPEVRRDQACRANRSALRTRRAWCVSHRVRRLIMARSTSERRRPLGRETIAAAGDSGDVLWFARIVLQLDAEIANVAVDNIVLGHVIGSSEIVQNLISRKQLPRIRGQ